jgi:hypothetical protein
MRETCPSGAMSEQETGQAKPDGDKAKAESNIHRETNRHCNFWRAGYKDKWIRLAHRCAVRSILFD